MDLLAFESADILDIVFVIACHLNSLFLFVLFWVEVAMRLQRDVCEKKKPSKSQLDRQSHLPTRQPPTQAHGRISQAIGSQSTPWPWIPQ